MILYPRHFRTLIAITALLLGAFAGSPVNAEEAWQQWIKPHEFEILCEDLSHNVDFFEKIWAMDPNAELYGGTSRDFVWHIRGELSKATSQAEMTAIVAGLRTKRLDVKGFVVGNSDVDVITDANMASVDYDRGMLTKIETISHRWFDPKSQSFEQETKQGHIPVEKMRLGKSGFRKTEGIDYGNGVVEIYYARPSLHYNPAIESTAFYKDKGNHEILPRDPLHSPGRDGVLPRARERISGHEGVDGPYRR